MLFMKVENQFLMVSKAEKVLFSFRQMLQILPIALAQVKAGNRSENLLMEKRQLIYSLYQAKEITQKV